MMTRENYLNQLHIKKELKDKMINDKYRLNFHLMPPSGWLNDPNGLCQFKGTNHIYYQYSPFTTGWGMKLWGHYTTTDWVTYQDCEPFLFSDIPEDTDGVYSGSAFIKNDKIYYYYTGNVKYLDGDYDYINNGREQNVIFITSEDGYSHTSKKIVLRNENYPENMSCHVRDPQIFKEDSLYYMVLGARTKDDEGCVLIYCSENLENWNYHMTIGIGEKFGYMWECPAIIDFSGKKYLLVCPQGVSQNGYDFANIYQTGMFEIDLNLKEKVYVLKAFKELDRGFDIYAPQVFKDENQRTILIGWMGIPDADYTNEPTVEKGWHHALTMPRELKIIDGKICQKPLNEFKKLRVSENKNIDCSVENAEIEVEFYSCKKLEIILRDEIEITFENEILTLNLEKCGYGRTTRSVNISTLNNLQIFLDNSCIEIFVNSGEEVFSSRCYCKNLNIDLKVNGIYNANITWYELQKFIIEEK